MKPFQLLLPILSCIAAATATAQSTSYPLADFIQVGTRIVHSPGTDALQLLLIIPPELMIYAGSKLSIRMSNAPARQFVEPPPSRVQMVDGTTHFVHSGAVTLNAIFPQGALLCGQTYGGHLLVQGCTTRICFAPEAIAFRATSSAC
jgi:hypothetical protein